VVEEISISIDMEDRIFSGNDITSGAATKTVSFTNPYKTVNYAVEYSRDMALRFFM